MVSPPASASSVGHRQPDLWSDRGCIRPLFDLGTTCYCRSQKALCRRPQHQLPSAFLAICLWHACCSLPLCLCSIEAHEQWLTGITLINNQLNTIKAISAYKTVKDAVNILRGPVQTAAEKNKKKENFRRRKSTNVRELGGQWQRKVNRGTCFQALLGGYSALSAIADCRNSYFCYWRSAEFFSFSDWLTSLSP